MNTRINLDAVLAESLLIGTSAVPDLDTATRLMGTETKEKVEQFYQLKSKIEQVDKWPDYYSRNIASQIQWNSNGFYADQISELTIRTITGLAVSYGAAHADEIKEADCLYDEIGPLTIRIKESFTHDLEKNV